MLGSSEGAGEKPGHFERRLPEPARPRSDQMRCDLICDSLAGQLYGVCHLPVEACACFR